MSKVEDYRRKLKSLGDSARWESYLLQESGLPGPRGNLELAQAVVAEGDEALFMHYRSYDATRAPVNSPEEFLAFCGVSGLGKLLAAGDRQALPLLRTAAGDPRWRTREAVAIALQTWGEREMSSLIEEMWDWSRGSRLEQRAAVAALCEPHLLGDPQHAQAVLDLLDAVTASLVQAPDRGSDEFKTLRKTLGYGWSVAVAAYPQAGKTQVERWFNSKDRDVLWVMRENLKKNRLIRMDAEWVQTALAVLQSP